MAFIKNKKFPNDIFSYYSIPEASDARSAARWFAKTITTKLNNVLSVEIDDLKTFHDGTDTTIISTIDDTSLFVEKWANVAKWLSASFKHNSVYCVLQVDMENAQIILGTKLSNESSLCSLEQLLGLV